MEYSVPPLTSPPWTSPTLSPAIYFLQKSATKYPTCPKLRCEMNRKCPHASGFRNAILSPRKKSYILKYKGDLSRFIPVLFFTLYCSKIVNRRTSRETSLYDIFESMLSWIFQAICKAFYIDPYDVCVLPIFLDTIVAIFMRVTALK